MSLAHFFTNHQQNVFKSNFLTFLDFFEGACSQNLLSKPRKPLWPSCELSFQISDYFVNVFLIFERVLATKMAEQMELVSLGGLVPEAHAYRRFLKIWDFEEASRHLTKLKKNNPHEGYGAPRLFKCLLLQFMENLSDREMERLMAENNAAKWFCGFSLLDKTPDHTVFCTFRKRLGTSLMADLFAHFRNQLKAAGYMSEVFYVCGCESFDCEIESLEGT